MNYYVILMSLCHHDYKAWPNVDNCFHKQQIWQESTGSFFLAMVEFKNNTSFINI